ncbi:PP2C family serine/threonine-protein phosphatase [Neobacillus mesonae]|uniref:PP2C family protein-serine/threonine phosphatase n=1 Tax=Neobacillus mesonae TaxID=1193713 RepID=UPI00203D29A2|nr:PP2C family serine/threonine-protein phosphatase [Neobacillus mesonae]MCM3567296.1 serine/threonine-protein phosphatase [Neobacillus mesonae]
MAFLTAYHTDVGTKKKTNQDGLLLKTAATPFGQVGLFVVCDGMGGLSHGELASAAVIRGLSHWFDNNLPELLRDQLEKQTETGSLSGLAAVIQTEVEAAIKLLNEKILQYGERTNVKLGTTVTALFILNDTYIIAHIGDSRAYCLGQREAQDSSEETQLLQQIQPEAAEQPLETPAVLTAEKPKFAITQLTTDQTLVAREVARGNMTLEQAERDPRRNVLLQCVGATNEIEIEFHCGEILENSVFVLCSDGFYHQISDDELEVHFSKKDLDLKETIVELVELVKSRGEVDNISVMAVRIS